MPVHPQVLITSPLEHARRGVQITRPVVERELIEAVATVLGRSVEKLAYARRPAMERGSAATVLVVDDNEVNREVLAEMLRRLGHSVTAAADGEQALSLATSAPFEAIFMDVQLPGMDGLEVTRRIRAGGSSVPVVGITAHTSRHDRDLCLAAGMNTMLTKPVTAAQLQAVLDATMKRDALAEATAGNPALLARVREAFSRQTPELLASIRDAIGAGDAESLARHAHKLKGSVSYFEGEALRLAREVEAAARGGNVIAAAALLPDLEIAVAKINERLAAEA